MTKETKKSEPLPEQFFYHVHFLKGSYFQVTADIWAMQGDWLTFGNRGLEVFRYRISCLAGWLRVPKPGEVT